MRARVAFLSSLLCSGVCGCGARSGLDGPEERPAAECTEPEFGVLELARCDPSGAEDASPVLGATAVPLAIEAFGCDGVLVLSGRELHVSTNGGARWEVLGGNLPSVQVSDLQLHPRDLIIVAATYGRGMWAVDASGIK